MTDTKQQHVETFLATGEGKGWPTKVSISGTEWEIQVDEPKEDGGNNSGPNPMQLFAASLVGCQNEQAQVVAEELSMAIAKIEIDVAIDLDLAGFMGLSEDSNGSYKRVRLTTIVHGVVTDEQVKELGTIVDSRCPILALLRTSGCAISSSWNIST
jgi:uncharacterized OsmC-like protein|tara:strand:+ start:1159 stop:1626 length:468 start_codon:yes stop_codon:yes gene_type:complete